MERASVYLPQKARLSQALKSLGLVCFGVVMLWWFGKGLNWPEVRRSISHADWGLLTLAVPVISLTYLLRAYRWRALLRPLVKAELRDLFIANVIGFTAFFLLGRAGEVVRPAVLPLRDRRVRTSAAFITIALERICDFVAVVLLFSFNLLWLYPPSDSVADFPRVRLLGLALFTATVIGLAAMICVARRADLISAWLEARVGAWHFARLGQLITRWLNDLSKAFAVLAYPSELGRAVFWTALVWFAIVAGNVLMIRSFGITFGFRETIFVLGWALVGSLVPTPGGGAGAFHAAAAAGLVFLGIARELAAAVAIVIHLIDFAPAVFFTFYYIAHGDVSVTRLREIRGSPVPVQSSKYELSTRQQNRFRAGDISAQAASMSSTRAEFDKFAAAYRECVNSTLGPAGEDSDYFARGRVDWLKRILAGELNIRTVMDYGCGVGLGTPHLFTLPSVEALIGIDVSEESLKQARANFSGEGVRFASLADYQPAAEVDLVVCCGVFHHIPLESRPEAVQFIYNSLRPGGWLAFWEHNPWNPGVVYIMNNSPIDQDAIRVNPHRARRMLRAAGFSLVRTDYLFFFPGFLGSLRFLEPALSRFPVGGQYLVLARKDA